MADEQRVPLNESVDTALREIFGVEQETDQRSGIVVDWVLATEVMGADGEPYVHTLRAPGSLAWRAIGLLTVHLDGVRDVMRGPAEDGDQ